MTASHAAQAGYSHVGRRLIPPTPTEPHYATIGDTPPMREVTARLIDRFGALCGPAVPFGIALSVEPVPWTELPARIPAPRRGEVR